MVDVVRYAVDKQTGLPVEPPNLENLEFVAEVGGEVDETSVGLRFFGDDLDPDELTQLLGHAPSRVFRRGDVYRGKRHDYVYKTGVWYLNVARSRQGSLENQIVSIFDQLTDDLAKWQALTQRYEADLFCGLWFENWNRELLFSPELMQSIAERGLYLHLDIYFELDEDE